MASKPAEPGTSQDNLLERLFKIDERGSTVGREVRGGFVTFFTMAYIIVLNPLILGFAQDGEGRFLGGGEAPDLASIAATTALVAGLLTILMGVVANYPLALAAGLGLNAFVASSCSPASAPPCSTPSRRS
jgi:AGZA family xanthine/uracil permease-like MFS transporter